MNIHIKFKRMFGNFVYVLLQTFLWLQILIFSTYIVHPKLVVSGNDAEAWLRELRNYHIDMQKIFIAYSVLLLIIFFVLLWNKRSTKTLCFYLALAIFTALFAFFATHGHTWYFYANKDQTINSIIMTTICLLLSFSLVCSKRLFARREVNVN